MELTEIPRRIAAIFRRKRPEPCLHPHLIFDWYRDMGIATCAICAEVFLVSQNNARDWSAEKGEGFDG